MGHVILWMWHQTKADAVVQTPIKGVLLMRPAYNTEVKLHNKTNSTVTVTSLTDAEVIIGG